MNEIVAVFIAIFVLIGGIVAYGVIAPPWVMNRMKTKIIFLTV